MQPIPRPARGVLPLAWLTLGVLTLGAQPSLTTIEDTVYRADGQRFNGTLLIEWRSFLLSDSTSVAAYSTNSRVINGVLKVSLFPTTTASLGAYYIVKYSNNGRILTTESWGVRPSPTSLKLKDVRLIAPPIGGAPAALSPAGAVTVEITDVIGLPDELAARAKKGLGYLPSRTAVINANGDLTGAVGEPTDCIRVNGTTGVCSSGGGETAFTDGETPAGLINGTNGAFTLANAPTPATSLQLYKNGVLQKLNIDYTLTGNALAFLSVAIPQTGDLLTASYRTPGAGGQIGNEAGGVLSGYFPAPSMAPGAIANQHISDSAAIVESKLALNFSTHANVNDPSSDQKAALQGTAGNSSNTNRFVTDQDSRLANARTPAGHALLGGAHYDANAAVAARGDVIVGIGTSPALWSRLPLGAPNRCLISNGFDAVWNSCLFTGFPAGSIPFIDSSGNLSHNNSLLYWNNSTRRLGLGTNTPTSTVTVQDSSVGSGQTTITVRAGDGQASVPLERWQSAAGSDLARVEADGQITAAAVRATTTAAHAAWQETGAASDPLSPMNGNVWLNTTEQARKSYEAGQAHTQPQGICSTAGISTSSLTIVSLGKCRIPAGMVRPGDRFEVRFDLAHTGSDSAFAYSVNWGAAVLTARSTPGTETGASGRTDAMPQGSDLYWNWQSWGSASPVLAGTGSAGSVPAGAIDVELMGQMSTTTSDSISLKNLTVIRIPGLVNP
ncbi:MAG TPA: hypothetical protein VM120_16465 [Bryobacteraceae bacterium]|nr:hypothetical protein [Bryobacteraceae bacterium]